MRLFNCLPHLMRKVCVSALLVLLASASSVFAKDTGQYFEYSATGKLKYSCSVSLPNEEGDEFEFIQSAALRHCGNGIYVVGNNCDYSSWSTKSASVADYNVNFGIWTVIKQDKTGASEGCALNAFLSLEEYGTEHYAQAELSLGAPTSLSPDICLIRILDGVVAMDSISGGTPFALSGSGELGTAGEISVQADCKVIVDIPKPRLIGIQSSALGESNVR